MATVPPAGSAVGSRRPLLPQSGAVGPVPAVLLPGSWVAAPPAGSWVGPHRRDSRLYAGPRAPPVPAPSDSGGSEPLARTDSPRRSGFLGGEGRCRRINQQSDISFMAVGGRFLAAFERRSRCRRGAVEQIGFAPHGSVFLVADRQACPPARCRTRGRATVVRSRRRFSPSAGFPEPITYRGFRRTASRSWSARRANKAFGGVAIIFGDGAGSRPKSSTRSQSVRCGSQRGPRGFPSVAPSRRIPVAVDTGSRQGVRRVTTIFGDADGNRSKSPTRCCGRSPTPAAPRTGLAATGRFAAAAGVAGAVGAERRIPVAVDTATGMRTSSGATAG